MQGAICDCLGDSGRHLISFLARAPARTLNLSFNFQQERSVIDESSFRAAQVESLIRAVDSTQSASGRCALQQLVLCQTSTQSARGRQAFLTELRHNVELRTKVEAIVKKYSECEASILDLAWRDVSGLATPRTDEVRSGFGYGAFNLVKSNLREICRTVEKGLQPTSTYGIRIFNDIAALKHSRYFKLLTQGYVSEHGPLTIEERSQIWFAAKFRPRLFKPWLIAGLLTLIAVTAVAIDARMGTNGPATVLAMLAAFSLYAALPAGLVYAIVVGTADWNGFIKPVGRGLVSDEPALTALDAFGECDALLSSLKYAEKVPHDTCLAEMVDADRHVAEFDDLRSPILALREKGYVGNDIRLSEARLTFVTGPNSGGKSALCLSLFQNQLLGQAGLFLTASSARLAPADRLYYQIPEVGLLEGAKGRFETELSRARDALFSASPRTFLVLDEPFEGTSFEERLAISRSALDAFMTIGGTTILITHNHHLAHLYQDRPDITDGSQFLMASYIDNRPSYTFVPGVATHSNAAEIAERIGFGPEDIAARISRSSSKPAKSIVGRDGA